MHTSPKKLMERVCVCVCVIACLPHGLQGILQLEALKKMLSKNDINENHQSLKLTSRGCSC